MREIPERIRSNKNGDATILFADGAAAAVMRRRRGMMWCGGRRRKRSSTADFSQRPSSGGEAHVDARQGFGGMGGESDGDGVDVR